MAALLAVGIGLGVEKLERKISKKRLEKKENKAIIEYESLYGRSSSSTTHTTQEGGNQTKKKREEAQHEVAAARYDEQNVPQYVGQRSSITGVRIDEETPPPKYEDAVQQDARREGCIGPTPTKDTGNRGTNQ